MNTGRRYSAARPNSISNYASGACSVTRRYPAFNLRGSVASVGTCRPASNGKRHVIGGQRQASIREMEEIAWVLRSDPRRNEIGFVKASKLEPQERYVLPDECD